MISQLCSVGREGSKQALSPRSVRKLGDEDEDEDGDAVVHVLA